MHRNSKPIRPKPQITIYPDHGIQGWLWNNFLGTDRLQDGVPPRDHGRLMNKIPHKLMEDFDDWHRVYRCDAYESFQGIRPFDWKSFHYIGIQLAVRLKQVLKDDARVFYEKPMEDPNDHLNQRREVLIDGQLI